MSSFSSLWKVTKSGPKPIGDTSLHREKLLEKNLEDWIAEQPNILGEKLWIIGRQISFFDTKDRLDLLALDSNGNAVIIELKRGALKDPVDFQALRYASYLSKWSYEDFERQALQYLSSNNENDISFNEKYEAFVSDAGSDEIPDINQDQRIILVGESIRDSLGSVALWLLDHKVDIKAIEVQAFREAGELIIQPNIIVPLSVGKFTQTGSGRSDGMPWKSDGRTWHLEKRCKKETRRWLEQVLALLEEHFDLDGPHWNQKHYIAYKADGQTWLRIETLPEILRVIMRVLPGRFTSADLGKRLGIKVFADSTRKCNGQEASRSIEYFVRRAVVE